MAPLHEPRPFTQVVEVALERRAAQVVAIVLHLGRRHIRPHRRGAHDVRTQVDAPALAHARADDVARAEPLQRALAHLAVEGDGLALVGLVAQPGARAEAADALRLGQYCDAARTREGLLSRLMGCLKAGCGVRAKLRRTG